MSGVMPFAVRYAASNVSPRAKSFAAIAARTSVMMTGVWRWPESAPLPTTETSSNDASSRLTGFLQSKPPYCLRKRPSVAV